MKSFLLLFELQPLSTLLKLQTWLSTVSAASPAFVLVTLRWSSSVSARPVSTSDRMSRRLLLLCVLISLGALNTEAASTLRSRRQAGECEEATDSFDECTNAWVECSVTWDNTDNDVVRAYDDYKAAFEAGDDGKPDWMARKACNYMTAAVEVKFIW